jgi:hypothetical protein
VVAAITPSIGMERRKYASKHPKAILTPPTIAPPLRDWRLLEASRLLKIPPEIEINVPMIHP